MDFTGWTAEQIWDFIEDPMSPQRWLPAAFVYWNEHFANEYPESPQSGGGRKGGLPPHG